MGKTLGHGAPLGAFDDLGDSIQRRSLGSASLSVLDLKAFYPNGFPPAVSAEEPQQSEPSASSTASEPSVAVQRKEIESVSTGTTASDLVGASRSIGDRSASNLQQLSLLDGGLPAIQRKAAIAPTPSESADWTSSNDTATPAIESSEEISIDAVRTSESLQAKPEEAQYVRKLEDTQHNQLPTVLETDAQPGAQATAESAKKSAPTLQAKSSSSPTVAEPAATSTNLSASSPTSIQRAGIQPSVSPASSLRENIKGLSLSGASTEVDISAKLTSPAPRTTSDLSSLSSSSEVQRKPLASSETALSTENSSTEAATQSAVDLKHDVAENSTSDSLSATSLPTIQRKASSAASSQTAESAQGGASATPPASVLQRAIATSKVVPSIQKASDRVVEGTPDPARNETPFTTDALQKEPTLQERGWAIAPSNISIQKKAQLPSAENNSIYSSPKVSDSKIAAESLLQRQDLLPVAESPSQSSTQPASSKGFVQRTVASPNRDTTAVDGTKAGSLSQQSSVPEPAVRQEVDDKARPSSTSFVQRQTSSLLSQDSNLPLIQRESLSTGAQISFSTNDSSLAYSKEELSTNVETPSGIDTEKSEALASAIHSNCISDSSASNVQRKDSLSHNSGRDAEDAEATTNTEVFVQQKIASAEPAIESLDIPASSTQQDVAEIGNLLPSIQRSQAQNYTGATTASVGTQQQVKSTDVESVDLPVLQSDRPSVVEIDGSSLSVQRSQLQDDISSATALVDTQQQTTPITDTKSLDLSASLSPQPIVAKIDDLLPSVQRLQSRSDASSATEVINTQQPASITAARSLDIPTPLSTEPSVSETDSLLPSVQRSQLQGDTSSVTEVVDTQQPASITAARSLDMSASLSTEPSVVETDSSSLSIQRLQSQSDTSATVASVGTQQQVQFTVQAASAPLAEPNLLQQGRSQHSHTTQVSVGQSQKSASDVSLPSVQRTALQADSASALSPTEAIAADSNLVTSIEAATPIQRKPATATEKNVVPSSLAEVASASHHKSDTPADSSDISIQRKVTASESTTSPTHLEATKKALHSPATGSDRIQRKTQSAYGSASSAPTAQENSKTDGELRPQQVQPSIVPALRSVQNVAGDAPTSISTPLQRKAEGTTDCDRVSLPVQPQTSARSTSSPLLQRTADIDSTVAPLQQPSSTEPFESNYSDAQSAVSSDSILPPTQAAAATVQASSKISELSSVQRSPDCNLAVDSVSQQSVSATNPAIEAVDSSKVLPSSSAIAPKASLQTKTNSASSDELKTSVEHSAASVQRKPSTSFPLTTADTPSISLTSEQETVQLKEDEAMRSPQLKASALYSSSTERAPNAQAADSSTHSAAPVSIQKKLETTDLSSVPSTALAQSSISSDSLGAAAATIDSGDAANLPLQQNVIVTNTNEKVSHTPSTTASETLSASILQKKHDSTTDGELDGFEDASRAEETVTSIQRKGLESSGLRSLEQSAVEQTDFSSRATPVSTQKQFHSKDRVAGAPKIGFLDEQSLVQKKSVLGGESNSFYQDSYDVAHQGASDRESDTLPRSLAIQRKTSSQPGELSPIKPEITDSSLPSVSPSAPVRAQTIAPVEIASPSVAQRQSTLDIQRSGDRAIPAVPKSEALKRSELPNRTSNSLSRNEQLGIDAASKKITEASLPLTTISRKSSERTDLTAKLDSEATPSTSVVEQNLGAVSTDTAFSTQKMEELGSVASVQRQVDGSLSTQSPSSATTQMKFLAAGKTPLVPRSEIEPSALSANFSVQRKSATSSGKSAYIETDARSVLSPSSFDRSEPAIAPSTEQGVLPAAQSASTQDVAAVSENSAKAPNPSTTSSASLLQRKLGDRTSLNASSYSSSVPIAESVSPEEHSVQRRSTPAQADLSSAALTTEPLRQSVQHYFTAEQSAGTPVARAVSTVLSEKTEAEAVQRTVDESTAQLASTQSAIAKNEVRQLKLSPSQQYSVRDSHSLPNVVQAKKADESELDGGYSTTQTSLTKPHFETTPDVLRKPAVQVDVSTPNKTSSDAFSLSQVRLETDLTKQGGAVEALSSTSGETSARLLGAQEPLAAIAQPTKTNEIQRVPASSSQQSTVPTASALFEQSIEEQAVIQRKSSEPSTTQDIPASWSNIEELVSSISDSPLTTQLAQRTLDNGSDETTLSAGNQSSTSDSVKSAVARPAIAQTAPARTISATATVPTVSVQPHTHVRSNSTPSVQAKADNLPTATVTQVMEPSTPVENQRYHHYVELLAQEVYGLLRQKLSLAQERKGSRPLR